MKKADVIAKFEEFKDRPIEMATNGAGDITLYGNIEGRWLFTTDSCVVAVAKNTANARYELGGQTQREMPFSILYVNYEDVGYVRSFINKDTIQKDLENLTPGASSKSIDEIIKEIESDSILKAHSANAYGSPFAQFKGSVISTSIDGVDKDYKNLK